MGRFGSFPRYQLLWWKIYEKISELIQILREHIKNLGSLNSSTDINLFSDRASETIYNTPMGPQKPFSIDLRIVFWCIDNSLGLIVEERSLEVRPDETERSLDFLLSFKSRLCCSRCVLTISGSFHHSGSVMWHVIPWWLHVPHVCELVVPMKV